MNMVSGSGFGIRSDFVVFFVLHKEELVMKAVDSVTLPHTSQRSSARGATFFGTRHQTHRSTAVSFLLVACWPAAVVSTFIAVAE